ncbi:hypothetical protein TWF569_010148 [Orbilia oligospora]|uniref:Uncharacterized protein n=1 Tax=Orbilia oligospora TaxID=2813651 RepID=A0A7C8J415_ORBOL|nr:hypothetical protein TWF103_002701 [Orbilia oligospora]KAF3084326.1 hypothetical protein TWF102_011971 [Orbilia oligospora]KAF3099386.1 hypothetical protein TWF706_006490 [Orbilia oligospora]KAF3134571.1 hypothetical protein TWF569_010148 [Orbilia oligospora]KAF3138440.1 hypothetical protein TWF594_007257 [Orbilia oligospora]
MRFNPKSMVLAILAAGATASPYPAKGSSCKSKCSPGQIDDAFNTPSYLPDTKNWCRKYLQLPATIWVTQTKTTYVTNYFKHTSTITKTYTANAVTVTNTDLETVVVTDQETSTTVETDFTTVVETSTSLITVVNEVTQTELATQTDDATVTTVVTNTDVVTKTDTILATSTVTKFFPKPYYQKRGEKVPSYLPQDMSPDQIGSHCKKINPCSTKTTYVTKTITIPSYKETKTVFTWVTVTPTATTVVTVVATNVETITVPETVTTTVVEELTTTIDSTAATVTEVVATETDTIATTVVIVATDTVTENTVNTVVATATSTVIVTTKAFCKKETEYCQLGRPEMCCSGYCVKVFNTPVCCVMKGAACNPAHPEGCCSGKCKPQGFSYGKPVYKCY